MSGRVVSWWGIGPIHWRDVYSRERETKLPHPDPFGSNESFGAHNNARLRGFLDGFGFDYEFASASDYYRSGRFDEALVRMLEVAAVHLDERRSRAPRRARPAAPGAEFRPLMDRLWRERAAAVLPGTIRRHGR